MIKPVAVAVIMLCVAHQAFGQRTGVLDPATQRVGVAGEFGLQSVTQAERVNLAVLLFDPQLERITRATAWAFNIVASQAGKEAKLQANLCDIGACTGRFTLGATVIAPIDSTTKEAQFADLDGLAGTARAEAVLSYGLVNASGAPTISLKAAAGRPKYSYRESGTLAAAELQEGIWSGSAAVAVKRTSWMAQASFTHEQSRKSQKATEVCTPSTVGPAGTVVCYSTPIGPPSAIEKNIAAVEAAYVLAGVAALRAKLSYDFKSEVTGIDIPIYVIPDVSGILSGGVRLGYRTDSDEFTAKLFFALFKL